jgi:hypothetical protein
MDRKQLEVLRALQIALEGATSLGVFDVLAIHVHPDEINRFCDGVNELEKAALEQAERNPGG